ncbi:MAG: DUF481 domain-containing protein [Lentimonas sp.]
MLFSTPKVVSLDSGERVVGAFLEKSTEETLYLQSGLLGEISIPRQRVIKVEPQDSSSLGDASKPSAVVVKEPAAPKVDAEVKQIALTEEEIGQIEERRVVDSLRHIKAPDSWNGNLRLGLNLSQGDRQWTETFLRGNLEVKPKGSPNFYRFNGSYTYRETQRSNGSSYKSTDKYDGSFIYRRTFEQNWFVQNSMGGRLDRIKGIDRELQEAVGVGYKFKPSGQFEFLLGGGGGIEDYQTDFEDSRRGLNPLMNVFQEATWRPWNRTSFVQNFNYYCNPEESEQFNYVLKAAIRFRVTDLVGLEFSFNKDFDNDIGNGESKDDTQWRNSLVVYF